jgi:hypothetical protein
MFYYNYFERRGKQKPYPWQLKGAPLLIAVIVALGFALASILFIVPSVVSGLAGAGAGYLIVWLFHRASLSGSGRS